MPSTPIGSIVYLNTTEIDNLLEGIEGGLVEQLSETSTKSRSKTGETALKVPLADTGISGHIDNSTTESTETTKALTPVGRLSRLRKQLISNEWVTYINTTDIEKRDEILENTLVEIQGEIVPSEFGEFTTQIGSMLELIEKFSGFIGNAIPVTPDDLEKMRYFADLGKKVVFVYIKPQKLASAKRGFDFACLLDPEKLRVSRRDLTGTVTLLGKVKKNLLRNEVKYPFEFIPGQDMAMGINMKSLIRSLTSSKKSSIRFSEEDVRVKFPSVIVNAYAIYQ